MKPHYYYDSFNGYDFTTVAQSRTSIDEGGYYEVKVIKTHDTVNDQSVDIHSKGLFIVDSRNETPEELQAAYENVRDKAKKWAFNNPSTEKKGINNYMFKLCKVCNRKHDPKIQCNDVK